MACRAFEAEEFFDHGTVEDGDRESADFLNDAEKVKQPKGLRRQEGFPYCYTLPHSCAEWGFSVV